MKYVLSIAAAVVVVVLLAAATGGGNNQQVGSNESVQPSAYIQQIVSDQENGEATVLDVRTPAEYNAGHVADAVNFNVEDMLAGQFPDLDKDSLIYVYCRSGNRSAQAKALMEQQGFTNIVDIGAFADWQASGGPVES